MQWVAGALAQREAVPGGAALQPFSSDLRDAPLLCGAATLRLLPRQTCTSTALSLNRPFVTAASSAFTTTVSNFDPASALIFPSA
jgi:hypothetical protein